MNPFKRLLNWAAEFRHQRLKVYGCECIDCLMLPYVKNVSPWNPTLLKSIVDFQKTVDQYTQTLQELQKKMTDDNNK